MIFQVITLTLMVAVIQCFAANILYAIPFTSKSHNIVLKPIGKALAHRGHNVTVITAYPEDNDLPNYRQIRADNTTIWEGLEQGRPNVFDMTKKSDEEFHDFVLWRGGLASTKITLLSPEVQNFLAEDNHFDLVIVEYFFLEALQILAHKYQAPLALVTTYGNCMRHNILVRNPLQLATVIPEFVEVREPMSLTGRLKVLYFTVYEYFWWWWWYMPQQQDLVKYVPGLPEPVPSLIDIQRNTSLMLLNSHFSYDAPTAYLPNVVEIGGIHLEESKQLPEDLQKVLDSSTEGVVYVNFGSNVKSSELPARTLAAFLNVFRRLNQTVLWKWEENNLPGKSDNVITRKWLPQNDILAHSNIRVFVSHGGLIGTEETIYHGVPVLGVPIYADQYNNLLQLQELGFGKILEFHSITEETLESSLQEMLKEKYRTRAKEISKRFLDRPMSPLDTAMFWIEYIIRNKGAEYMKSPALKLNWFQYSMLDVCAWLLLCTLVPIFVIHIFFKVFSKK